MLGFDVAERTDSRYLRRFRRRPQARQNWLTFLRNHRDAIAALDFFVVFSTAFRPLHVLFVIEHARRRILRLLREYVGTYCLQDRTHLGLAKDSPAGRAVEHRPSPCAKVIARPRCDGLHHRYVWREAA